MDTNIPRHIASILDGNERWEKKRMLPCNMGHREGVKAMQRVIELCRNCGIEVVSFYVFSTENWSRPAEEVSALFGMLKTFSEREMPRYAKKNYVIRFMGDLGKLLDDIRESIESNIKTL